jgi:hypothetical protein
MKKIILPFLAIASLHFTACNEPIIGTGTPVSEIRKTDKFNAVICDLAGNVNIVCAPDTTTTVSITAQPNLLPLLECLVEKDELLVRFKRGTNITSADPVNVTIAVPTLKSLKMLGSGNGVISGKLITPSLLCAMMGSGDITVNGATIGKLRADITGSGEIKLLNTTNQKAEYAIKGSGKISAFAAPTDTVKAIVAGSGDINCMAIKILDAEINGSGNIDYLGKPTVIKNKIGGNGTIKGDGVLAETAK